MGYNKRNDEINAITKESIAFAYCELLQNEQNISVTMICEKAGVSRNAYYRNFNSTDEIIIYCLILKWAKYCEINCAARRWRSIEAKTDSVLLCGKRVRAGNQKAR